MASVSPPGARLAAKFTIASQPRLQCADYSLTMCFALGGRPRVCTGRCAFQLLPDFCRDGPSGYGGRAHGSYRRRKGRGIEAAVAAMSATPLVAMIESRYS
jgi:hypothetical protein